MIDRKPNSVARLFPIILATLLVACGGGGGSSDSSSSSSSGSSSSGGSAVTTMQVFPSLGQLYDYTLAVTTPLDEPIDDIIYVMDDTLPIASVTLPEDFPDDPLVVTITGNASATYFDEATNGAVPFTADDSLRVYLPSPQAQVGITALTTIAASKLDQLSNPTADEIRDVNNGIGAFFSGIADITLPPFVVGPLTLPADVPDNPSGEVAVAAWAGANLNAGHIEPALASMNQLILDASDSVIDGQNYGSSILSPWDPPTTFSSLWNNGLDACPFVPQLNSIEDNADPIDYGFPDSGPPEVANNIRAYKDASGNILTMMTLQHSEGIFTLFSLQGADVDNILITMGNNLNQFIQVSTGSHVNTIQITPAVLGDRRLFVIETGNLITVTNLAPAGQTNFAVPPVSNVSNRTEFGCARMTLAQILAETSTWDTPVASVANGAGGTFNPFDPDLDDIFIDPCSIPGAQESFENFPGAVDFVEPRRYFVGARLRF